jgi:predicted SAM-dependent methyltransferase
MRKLLLAVFSHRTLALIRWDLHFLAIRLGNFFSNRKSRFLNDIYKRSGPLYLNLGSGPRGKVSQHWVNVDGFKDKNVDFLCDFSRKLPFRDKVFDGIFCEHVFEHFSNVQGIELMKECNRVMKEGAVLRIIVPDGKKILASYFDAPDHIVKYKEVASGQPMEAVNTWFYQRYEHQCIYDAPFLIQSLKTAGFQSAAQSSFGNSVENAEAIVIDDEKYSWESLYIEAVK